MNPGVNKWYRELHVLRDINLKVGRGEKLVIFFSQILH